MKRADLIRTFAPVPLVLFFTLQRGNAFLLVLLLLLFLPWAIVTSVRMVRRPGERKGRAPRLAVWSAALVLSVVVQTWWGLASRGDAELAVAKVAAYKERAGSYPADLGEVGLDAEALKKKSGLRYSVRDGKPALVYPAPVMPLTLREYDFTAGGWRRNAY